LCGRYAGDHSVVFNGNKSKSIIRHPHNNHANRLKDVPFSFSGYVIETVNTLHLGHNISNNGTDRVAISNCHSTFIGQANDVICWFNVLDYNINTKLLKRFVQVYTDVTYGILLTLMYRPCVKHGDKHCDVFGNYQLRLG